MLTFSECSSRLQTRLVIVNMNPIRLWFQLQGAARHPAVLLFLCLALSCLQGCLALPVLGIVMTCIFLTRAYYYTLIILYGYSYCTATAHLHQIQLHAASCGRSHGRGNAAGLPRLRVVTCWVHGPIRQNHSAGYSRAVAESQQLRRAGYCHWSLRALTLFAVNVVLIIITALLRHLRSFFSSSNSFLFF